MWWSCIDGFVHVWICVRYQRACAAWWDMTQSYRRACAALQMQIVQSGAELPCYHIAFLGNRRVDEGVRPNSSNHLCAYSGGFAYIWVCMQAYQQPAALCWAQRGSSSQRSPHQTGKRWTDKESCVRNRELIAQHTHTHTHPCTSHFVRTLLEP